MKIELFVICFLFFTSCKSVELDPICLMCEKYLKENKSFKSIKLSNPSKKDSFLYHIVEYEYLSKFLNNKFCFLNMNEKAILEFFNGKIYKRTNEKIRIKYGVKNIGDSIGFIDFVIKEVDGKRINIGDEIDLYELEHCILLEKQSLKN